MGFDTSLSRENKSQASPSREAKYQSPFSKENANHSPKIDMPKIGIPKGKKSDKAVLLRSTKALIKKAKTRFLLQNKLCPQTYKKFAKQQGVEPLDFFLSDQSKENYQTIEWVEKEFKKIARKNILAKKLKQKDIELINELTFRLYPCFSAQERGYEDMDFGIKSMFRTIKVGLSLSVGLVGVTYFFMNSEIDTSKLAVAGLCGMAALYCLLEFSLRPIEKAIWNTKVNKQMRLDYQSRKDEPFEATV